MEISLFRSLPVGRNAPDMLKDPRGWNQAWSTFYGMHLKMWQSSGMGSLMDLYKNTPAERDSSYASQDMLQSLEQRRRSTRELQVDMAEFLQDRPDFEEKWLKFSAREREDIILRGLVDTCTISSDGDRMRDHCPETAISELQKLGGRGFLNLVRAVQPLPETSASVSTSGGLDPSFVPHPVVDNMLGLNRKTGLSEGQRLIQRHMALQRSFFLSMFVWKSVLFMYGKSEKTMNAKVMKAKTELKALKEKKDQMEMIGLDPKYLSQKVREDKKTHQWACDACGKMESMLGGGQKMQLCGPCKRVGREVRYCDRQCQSKDWKQGDPPHKAICGRALEI